MDLKIAKKFSAIGITRNRQDLFAFTHHHKRKTLTPTCTRCSQNHNNIRAHRKSENSRFEI